MNDNSPGQTCQTAGTVYGERQKVCVYIYITEENKNKLWSDLVS